LHGIAEPQEMETMSGENEFVAKLFKVHSTFLTKNCATPLSESVLFCLQLRKSRVN